MRIFILVLGFLATVAVGDRHYSTGGRRLVESPFASLNAEVSSAGQTLSPRADHPSGKPLVYPSIETLSAILSPEENKTAVVNTTHYVNRTPEVKPEVSPREAEVDSNGFTSFLNDESGAEMVYSILPFEPKISNTPQLPIPEEILHFLRSALHNATNPADITALSAMISAGQLTLKCETSGGSPLLKDVVMCAAKLDENDSRCRQTNPFGSKCTKLVSKGTAAVSICGK
jgi:hypothetical protein